jgi:hypothetical protein
VQVIKPTGDLDSLSDTDMEEDLHLQNTGIIEEIGGTRIYLACPIPPCSRKKLTSANTCPRCNQTFPEERAIQTVTTQLGIKSNNEILNYRLFGTTVSTIFMAINTPMPTTAEEIEDSILDHLPLNCTYSTGNGTSSNVISCIAIQK